jgi:hypothetical protein
VIPIDTRVGHIGYHDHRFCGRSVFEQMGAELSSPSDALAMALGLTPDDDDREALRLVTLCTTSPDARVWPLKLCRLLSSWGDPMVGFFGAQLVSAGRLMGSGTASGCAAALCFVAEQSAGDLSDEAVGAAVDRWRAEKSRRISGFGVPFRAHDERLMALRRAVAGTPLERRPYWRLQERVAAALASRIPEQPNVVLGDTALLLDAGVAPERCSMALALCMSHMFVAHALEATTDGPALHALASEHVQYVGRAPRSTARGAR